jgi:hypothetical protein
MKHRLHALHAALLALVLVALVPGLATAGFLFLPLSLSEDADGSLATTSDREGVAGVPLSYVVSDDEVLLADGTTVTNGSGSAWISVSWTGTSAGIAITAVLPAGFRIIEAVCTEYDLGFEDPTRPMPVTVEGTTISFSVTELINPDCSIVITSAAAPTTTPSPAPTMTPSPGPTMTPSPSPTLAASAAPTIAPSPHGTRPPQGVDATLPPTTVVVQPPSSGTRQLAVVLVVVAIAAAIVVLVVRPSRPDRN